MELYANYLRGQYSDIGKKGVMDISSRAGSEVVKTKTKSNYIRAAYEAASSFIKNAFF